MRSMVLCAACKRRVCAAEAKCPFCGRAFSSDARRLPGAAGSPEVSRAQRYALGAALAATVAGTGCTFTTQPIDPDSRSVAGNPPDAPAVAPTGAQPNPTGAQPNPTGAAAPTSTGASASASATGSPRAAATFIAPRAGASADVADAGAAVVRDAGPGTIITVSRDGGLGTVPTRDAGSIGIKGKPGAAP